MIPVLGIPIFTNANESTTINTTFLERSKIVALVPETANLIGIDSKIDSSSNRETVSISWQTKGSDLIEVEFDSDSGDLLYYIDTTRESNWDSTITNEDAKRAAYSTGLEFIQLLHHNGIFRIPENAVFEEVLKGTTGWVLTWKNVHEGISVKDDIIKLQVDPRGNNVVSFSNVWHEVTASSNPKFELRHVLVQLESLGLNSEVIDANLEYVVDGFEPVLAWKLDLGSEKVWIDSSTLEIVDTLSYLVDYRYDYFGWDDVGPLVEDRDERTYDACWSMYLRGRTALYYPSSYAPRYLPDSSKSYELSQLIYEKGYYHLGHGAPTQISGLWYTGIWAGNTGGAEALIVPNDIKGKDLSGMYLSFPCCCWSAADNLPSNPLYWATTPRSQWTVSVTKSICGAFIDRGAKCVLGWDEPVDKVVAMEFSAFFYDKLVNGYSFSTSYSYAKSRVDTRNLICGQYAEIDRIYGNTGLTLTKDDAPGEYFSTALYLGTGSWEDLFTYTDEGLWYTDVDTFLFTSDGSWTVTVTVTPVDDDHDGLDVRLRIYTTSYAVVCYKNSGGVGQPESYTFTANGGYYIKIYDSTSGPPHGGAYSLSVQFS